jgi:formylglycine-generating enzyme required for sulfatase activity
MGTIFISYRRSEDAGTCGRLYDRLMPHFGRDRIFRDVDSIPLGVDYKARIQSEIDKADVQLVLIGRNWLAVPGRDGRRLDDPNDPVRIEVVAALERHIVIIPLLVDDATFPEEDDLPPDIRQLHAQNGLPIRNGADFEFDMQRLVAQLHSWIPDQPSGATRIEHMTGLQFELYSVSGTEFFKPPICTVSAGPFTMGSDRADDERPSHSVGLPMFEIGKHPVTVAEYACFVRVGHRAPLYLGMPWEDVQRKRYNHPVVGVSWQDAVEYAAWLARLTGEGWRLPSEAEWEKAASWESDVAIDRVYPWGREFDATRCNTNESDEGSTTPIDKYGDIGASPFGVHDMAGNVWEWTSTLYRPYRYDPLDGRESPDTSGPRVRRGGSWDSQPENARCAKRAGDRPDRRDRAIGFRLVRGPAVGS